MFGVVRSLLPILAPLVGAEVPAVDSTCRVVEVDFVPTENLQVVAWIETAAGQYVATIYVTASVGRYGLGNRPGMMEFNSSPRWPYGARFTTFPIWAHRHGQTFPQVHFLNADGDSANNDPLDGDRNLSHPFNHSSAEPYFCRPLRPAELDAGCTASMIYTDKGKLSATRSSLYPPRADIGQTENDDPSVISYPELNPFDEVSAATPLGGAPTTIAWPIPGDLPMGDYRLFVEVAKEFDHNASYTPAMFPSPMDILWSDYGLPYRGQPSVLYDAAFTIGPNQPAVVTSTYAGYGDPEGLDGVVRAPDESISLGVPGSGAERLALAASGVDGTYRLRVHAKQVDDAGAPGEIAGLAVIANDASTADVVFRAPGDDAQQGVVSSYEIRYSARPITPETFAMATPLDTSVAPLMPGAEQAFRLTKLLPLTTYYIAVKAIDDCRNESPLAFLSFTTTDRQNGAVDACFIATAAYGSLLADEVMPLRQLRDGVLRKHGVGELVTQAYYTFGPPLAAVTATSPLLRQSARALLSPLIAHVRTLWVPPWIQAALTRK